MKDDQYSASRLYVPIQRFGCIIQGHIAMRLMLIGEVQ